MSILAAEGTLAGSAQTDVIDLGAPFAGMIGLLLTGTFDSGSIQIHAGGVATERLILINPITAGITATAYGAAGFYSAKIKANVFELILSGALGSADIDYALFLNARP